MKRIIVIIMIFFVMYSVFPGELIIYATKDASLRSHQPARNYSGKTEAQKEYGFGMRSAVAGGRITYPIMILNTVDSRFTPKDALVIGGFNIKALLNELNTRKNVFKSAKLRLFINYGGSSRKGIGIFARRILKEWDDEAITYNDVYSKIGQDVPFTSLIDSNDKNAGFGQIDVEANSTDTPDVLPFRNAPGFLEIDVTEIVKAWIEDPASASYGILVDPPWFNSPDNTSKSLINRKADFGSIEIASVEWLCWNGLVPQTWAGKWLPIQNNAKGKKEYIPQVVVTLKNTVQEKPVEPAISMAKELTEMKKDTLGEEKPEGKLVNIIPTEDTWVNAASHQKNLNFGHGRGWIVNGVEGEPALFSGFWGRDKRIILLQGFHFDSIPKGTKINKALLKLFMVYSGSAKEIPVSIRKIESPWKELKVTYATLPRYSKEKYGTTTLTGTLLQAAKDAGEGVWFSWDVTDLVNEWIRNPSTNYGLLLFPEGESGTDRQFDCNESRENFGPRIELYVPEETKVAASEPPPEKKKPVETGKAPYPDRYLVSEDRIQQMIQAVKEVDGSDPHIQYYTQTETDTEFNFKDLKSTEKDIKNLKKVIEILKKKDPEGLWVMTNVGVYRPEMLLVFLRSGDNQADMIETVIHELTHGGSGIMSPFMHDSYFSGKANSRTYSITRGYSFLIDNECVGIALPKYFYYRSEILQYIPENDVGEIESVYLTGSCGQQDFLTLLDELNAYTRGLRNNIALYNMQPAGKDLAFRALKFLYFMELYLKHARTKVPDDYKALVKAPEIAMIIRKLVYNLEKALEQIPGKPYKSGKLYKTVLGKELYGELENYYTDTGIPDVKDKPFSHLPATNRFRSYFILVY